MVNKKIRFILLIGVSLLIVSGCSLNLDSFGANNISGHVILSNTEIETDKFDLASNQSSQVNNIVKNNVKKEYVDNEVVIKFKNVNSKSKDYLLKKYDLSLAESLEQGQVYLVKTSNTIDLKELITKLEQKEIVEYAEFNAVYSINVDHPTVVDYDQQWHYSAISLPEAWANGYKGNKDVTVAVVDTGINDTHSEFNSLTGNNFVSDYSTDHGDDNGHGTHVAGVINVDNENRIVSSSRGVNLLAIKALDEEGNGSMVDIAKGVEWAVDQGADVINLSLGSALPSEFLKEKVNYAYKNDVTVIAASGNSSRSSVGFPARYDNVISVGAIDSSLDLVNFSNRGINLDLVAPGKNIYSTVPKVDGDDDIIDSSGYNSLSGTSMAAPHVSGIAALLIANNIATTPDEIKKQLQLTAQDLGAQNSDNPGWDHFYGYGLINAYAALKDARINKGVVFAGEKNGDTIKRNTDFTTINKDGFYELNLSSQDYVFAWIDVEDNDKIDIGDYFAKVELNSNSGVNTNLKLELLNTNYNLQ